MNNRRFALAAGGGCSLLAVFAAAVLCALFFLPLSLITNLRGELAQEQPEQVTLEPGVVSTQEAIPTLPATSPEAPPTLPATELDDADASLALFPLNARQAQEDPLLTALYDRVNPGVVNIQVSIEQGLGGQGAGSGFLIDEQGHIVTNNHVVAGASRITVVYHNGFESEATIVGRDDDSDLAVVRVDDLPEGVQPLPVGDSTAVQTGEWVVAIGNPFSLGGSMTLGIVSAVGRIIPSGVTPFSIPQAIQTDAAINPGNSGGPLLNLAGEVIGVNAQIRTDPGVAANAGVGFAIPANVVRRVVPVLIEQGSYEWPWLGIEGLSVNLLVQEEFNLDTQTGAFVRSVVTDGPAAQAGLRSEDIIVRANGEPIESYDQLLTMIAFSNPGETVELVVIRNGERQEVSVTLAARPDFEQ